MVMNDSPELTFKPLGRTFGAECSGVDFSKPISTATVAAIRAAMARYGVLVFRGTGLDNAGHVALAGQFGELDDATTWIKDVTKYRLYPYVQLNDVSNIEADGSITSTDGLRHQMNRGNALFHVDCSYNARRAGFSLLLAHQLPPAGTGGGTAFADTRTAWDDLDPAKKEEVRDVVLCHSVWQSRIAGAPDCAVIQGIKPEEHFMARHRLVQTHEPSGRENMYIAKHAHHVDGWTADESKGLIGDLLEHASQDKYTFNLEWKTVGDLVIWDNTCVMHRALGGDFEGKHVRDLRRATVHDSSSTAWGLNERDGTRAGMFTKEMKAKTWAEKEADAAK
ncbi:alpha-ketoglutarate-dependent 2 [Diaporthe helianthi]|uniref:Alpha-ketoglutarate-dependent 2 n=1 Tax=Diaporthe helianthi TaxID=158607 RepID=A0A2P5HYD2_DIAHE|nr:alpha-ketoglutarate-dependent 2 [Diaporthe helianthi]